MNFKEVLDIHLKSIENRELDIFITTISEEDVTLIMPNGILISGREQFIEFHREWFLDKDWNFNYEILKMEENTDLAHVLLKIHYNDIDENGKKYSMEYYLTLIFKKINGKWGLIYDQNTLVNNKK